MSQLSSFSVTYFTFFNGAFMNTPTTVISLNSTGTDAATGARSAANSLLLQLVASAILGLVIFYGVAFAESSFVHNAAHDVRHITVQPCH
jgi:cobalt transporter subunit CbtB